MRLKLCEFKVAHYHKSRSMLQTDQQFPSKGSHSEGIQKNADGSYDLYFGPIQTVPGRGWFTILRLYGPIKAASCRSHVASACEVICLVAFIESASVSCAMFNGEYSAL
jgi:hypothetical protein